jgi:uncharacterized delta-60 repeat protein
MITSRPITRARHLSFVTASLISAGRLFAQDGALDITFSSDGQYGFMPQLPDVSTVDILESDGLIFPVLSAVNGTTSSYLMKLNNDGSLVGSFGTGGILEYPNTSLIDAALSLDESRIFLLRSDVDVYRICSIDLNGAVVQPWTVVTAPYGLGFAKMLVDDQGRICIGKGANIDGTGYGQVIRLNPDFTVDNTFGTNGVAYTPTAPFSYPLMEIDHLGRIVLASYGLNSAGIWRFNANGSVDGSFDYALDLSTYSLDNWILDIAIAQDNSIYVQPNTWGWPAYLFKLNEDGSLDTGFGTGGSMDLSDTDQNYYTAPDELLIEPNGGLIILAQAYGADGYMSAKYLTRLDEFGVLDTDFNPGIQPIDDNGYGLRINFHCATLQDDGKVLSMDQVVKWQNGTLFGYAPLITRFNNEKGSVIASVNDAGPRVDEVYAYPNPTHGSVALRLPDPGAWRNATAVITNNAGAIVIQQRFVNELLDLSALSAGVYHCEVMHEEGSVHARIVKE